MAYDFSQYDDEYLLGKAREAFDAGRMDWAEIIRDELWRRQDELQSTPEPQEPQKGAYGWWRGVGASTMGMGTGAASGFASAITNPGRTVLGMLTGNDPEEIKLGAVDQFAEDMRVASEDLKQEGYLSEGGDNFFTQLVTSTIQMAPSVAVGRYTKSGNAGLTVMGGVVFSTTLAAGMAAGMSEKEAMREAFLQTAFELGPEKAFGFFDNLPIAAGAKQWMKQSLAEGLSEMGTEELSIWYEAHKGDDSGLKDWSRRLLAGAAGLVMGGTLGAGALSSTNRERAAQMKEAGINTEDRWRPGSVNQGDVGPEGAFAGGYADLGIQAGLSEDQLAIGRADRYMQENEDAALEELRQRMEQLQAEQESYLEYASEQQGYDPAEVAKIEEEARRRGVTAYQPREEDLKGIFIPPQGELDLNNPADQREAIWLEATQASTELRAEEQAAWQAFEQTNKALTERYDETFNELARSASAGPSQGRLDLQQRPTPAQVLGPSRTTELTRDVSEAPVVGQEQLRVIDRAVEDMSVEQLLDEYVNVAADPEAAETAVAQYYNGRGIFGTATAKNAVLARAKEEVKAAWREPLEAIVSQNRGVNVSSEELEWYKSLPYNQARQEVSQDTLAEADKQGNTEFTDKDRQRVADFNPELVEYYSGSTGSWKLIGFNPETGRVVVEYRAKLKDKNGEQTYLRYYWKLGESFAPKKLLKNGEWDAQWRNRQRKNLQTKDLTSHIPKRFRTKLENALGGYMEGEARTGSRRMKRMQPEQWITPQTKDRAVEFEAARRIKERRAGKRAEQYREPTPTEIREELKLMEEEGLLPKTPKPTPVKDTPGLYETTDEAVEKEAERYRTRARQRLVAKQGIDTALTEEEIAEERAAAEREIAPRQQRTVDRVKAEMAARFTGKVWNRPKEWAGFPKFEEDGPAADQIVTIIEDQGVINRLNSGVSRPERVVQVLPSGQIRVIEIVPTEVGKPYTIQVRSMGRNNYVRPRVMGTIGGAYKESAARALLKQVGPRGLDPETADVTDPEILARVVKASWTAPTEQDRLIEEMESAEIGSRKLDETAPKKKKRAARKQPIPDEQLRPEEYRLRRQTAKLRKQIEEEREAEQKAKAAWQAAVKAGRPDEEIRALRSAHATRVADLKTSRSLYNQLRSEGVVQEDLPKPEDTFVTYVEQLRRDREVDPENRLTPEERWPLVREIIDRRNAEKRAAAMDRLLTGLVQDGRFGTRAAARNRLKAELQVLESALLDSFDNILRNYYRTDVADYILRGEPTQDDYVGDAYQPLYPGSGQVDLTATGNAQRAAIRGMTRTILRENPQIYSVLLENNYLKKRLSKPDLTEMERSQLESQYLASAQKAEIVVEHLGSIAKQLKEFLVTANPEVLGGVAMTQKEAEGRRARGTAWDITLSAQQARNLYKLAAARSEAASEMMVPTEIIREIRKSHGLEEFTKDDLLPYIRRRSPYSKAVTKKELDLIDDTADPGIESPYVQHGEFEFGLTQFQAAQARLEAGYPDPVPGVFGGTVYANEPILDQLLREFVKLERAEQGETTAAALSGETMQNQLDRMRASVKRDAEAAAAKAREDARAEMERTAEEMGRLREERDAARREAEQTRGERELKDQERAARRQAAQEDRDLLLEELQREAAASLEATREERRKAAELAKQQRRLERSDAYLQEVAIAAAEDVEADRVALEEAQASQLELSLFGEPTEVDVADTMTPAERELAAANKSTVMDWMETGTFPAEVQRSVMAWVEKRRSGFMDSGDRADKSDSAAVPRGAGRTMSLDKDEPVGAAEFEASVAMDSATGTEAVRSFLSYYGSRNMGLRGSQREILKLFPRAIGRIQEHVNRVMDQWAVAQQSLKDDVPNYERYNTTYDNAVTDYLQDMSVDSVLAKHGVQLPAKAIKALDNMKADILALGKAGLTRGAWDQGSVIGAILNQRGYLHRTAKQSKRTKQQLKNMNAELARLAKLAWRVPTTSAELMDMSNSRVLAMLADKSHRMFDDYLTNVQVAHPDGKTYRHVYLKVGGVTLDLGKPHNGALTKKVVTDQLRRENPKATKEELAALYDARMNKVKHMLSEHLPTDETYRTAVAKLGETMLQDFEAVASGRWMGKGGDVSIKRARRVLKSDADMIAQATDTLWQNAPEEIRKEVKDRLLNERERNRTKSFKEFLMHVKNNYPDLTEAISKAEAQYEFSQALRSGLNEVTDPETTIFDTVNRLAESVYTSDLLMNMMKMGVEGGWVKYGQVGKEGEGWESLAPVDSKLGKTPVAIPGSKISEETGAIEYIYASDIRVPAEVARAVQEAMGVNKEKSNEYIDAFRKASIYTKWGLVIGSVGGQARNFVSTSLIHFTRNPVGYGWSRAHALGQALARHQAYKGLTRKKRALGTDSAEERENLRRAKRLEQVMLEYGMLYDGGKSGALWDIRRQGLGATSQRTAGFHKLGAKGAQAANAAEEMFRLSDEWVKMPAFMMRTYEYLSYAGADQAILDSFLDGKKLSSAESAALKAAMDMASESVLDEYPTFSRINRIGKLLSRNPVVGAFPGFQFEMIRTTKNAFNNNWKLMMGQFPNGTPIPKAQRAKAQAMGAARTMMTLSSISALSVIGKLLLSLTGDDDEDALLMQQTGGTWERAQQYVRGILPWWARDTQVAVRDVDKTKHTYSVLRMDYMWATGGLENAARAATTRIQKALADDSIGGVKLAQEIAAAAWDGVQPIAFNQEPFLDNIRKRIVKKDIETRQKDKWSLRHLGDVIDRTLGGDSENIVLQWAGAAAGGAAESLPAAIGQVVDAVKFVYEGAKEYPDEDELAYVADLALQSAGYFTGLKLEQKEFVTDLAPQIRRDASKFSDVTTLMKKRLEKAESYEDVVNIVTASEYVRRDAFREVHAGLNGAKYVLGVPENMIEHYVKVGSSGGTTLSEFGRGSYSPYSPLEFDKYLEERLSGVDPDNPNEVIDPLTREKVYNLRRWYRDALLDIED